MNIQQLLTTFQSAGASSATPETTTTTSAEFQRALGTAASALTGRFTLGDDIALATDAKHGEGEQALTALLDGLDIELDAEALAELLAGLGMQTEATLPGTTLDATGIAADDGTTDETSGLDQIAQRLALMAAFAEPASSSAPSASPQGVKQVAELLAISEGDAATLIAALQGQRDARPAVDSASRAAPIALASAPLATQAQPTTWQPAAPLLDAAVTLRAEPATPAWSSMATVAAPWATRVNEPSTSMTPLVGTADAAAPRLPMSPTSTAQTSVATPVQSPAWPQQVGQQLVHFIQRGGEQHVQMQLHPAELGPLSIALTVGEQGTQAHFVSAHAQVRQVLEHALPQLREALAEQGITLSDTSVGDQRRDQQEAFAQSSARRGMAGGSGGEPMALDEGAPTQRPRSMTLDGRIDLYA